MTIHRILFRDSLPLYRKMVMKQDEQLNRYFEHTMTPSEEQNFLISVAASDQMRIAFRSQLELMKAVRSDKDALHAGMSGHPVAHVRYRTLAALGLSATAAPLLDQEFTRESATQAAEMVPKMSFFSNILRMPKVALTAGLALGILSTTAVMRFTEGGSAPVVQTVTTIPSVVPVKTPINFSPNETIVAPNGLNNSSHSEGVAVHHADHASTVGIAQMSAKTAASNTVPETSTSNAGTMQTHKATIKRPNDSSAAK
jgi:hypothetical protein